MQWQYLWRLGKCGGNTPKIRLWSRSTTTSCSPIRIPSIRSCSVPSKMLGIWGPRPWVQPFILVQRKAAVRSSRWLRPSNMHANWAWPPSCGATLEIQLQDRRKGLPHICRSYRASQSFGCHHSSRHHQAENARLQWRIQSPEQGDSSYGKLNEKMIPN